MLKYTPLVFITLSFTHYATAHDSKAFTSTLKKATIYNVGATLEHQVEVNIPKGNSEIIIEGVATNVDMKSIQINNTKNLSILSYRFENAPPKNKNVITDSVINAYTDTKKKLKELNNKKETLEETLDLIDDNSELKGANTTIKVEDLEKLSDFYLKKKLEIRNNIDETEAQIAKLQATDNVLTAMMGYQSQKEVNPGRIILDVIAEKDINQNITFSYLTNNVNWYPRYDVRVESVYQPINIIYKAAVKQWTGIDWKNVNISLSTASPNLSKISPELKTWYLEYFQEPIIYEHRLESSQSSQVIYGQKIDKRTYVGGGSRDTSVIAALEGAAPGVNVKWAGGQPGSSTDIMLRGLGSLSGSSAPLIVIDGAPYSGSLSSINPNEISSMTVLKDATSKAVYGSRAANGVILVTTKKNSGVADYTSMSTDVVNTTFDIAIPYNIPSDSKENIIAIKDISQPVNYEYVAIPKLDNDAYLTAQLFDYEKHNIIPAEANIIFENNFIGKSLLNTKVANDTIPLSLGQDKQIVVKRERIFNKDAQKITGNFKKEVFTYEITVKNNKSKDIKLNLFDQYPTATNNTITVELGENSGAIVNKETGALKWELNLAPNEVKKVKFTFTVKYNKDQKINIQ